MNWNLSSYGPLVSVVEELLSILSPYCQRISPIGLLPRKNPVPVEIRLLVIPKVERIHQPDGLFQDSVEINRLEEKLQQLQNRGEIRLSKNQCQFKFLGAVHPFKVKVSTEEAWYANLVQASSFQDVYLTLATAAKNQGLKWTPAKGGYEDLSTGMVRVVKSEEEVFGAVKMPYIPPEKRNRWPVFEIKQSGLPPILTQDQIREWVKSVPWTDTACGGEAHQYTFRTSGDERTFVHIAEFIREFGYDGIYLRKKWRYLDLDGMCYFTCGTALETTSLLNRKKLQQPETQWARNSSLWIPLTQYKSN